MAAVLQAVYGIHYLYVTKWLRCGQPACGAGCGNARFVRVALFLPWASQVAVAGILRLTLDSVNQEMVEEGRVLHDTIAMHSCVVQMLLSTPRTTQQIEATVAVSAPLPPPWSFWIRPKSGRALHWMKMVEMTVT